MLIDAVCIYRLYFALEIYSGLTKRWKIIIQFLSGQSNIKIFRLRWAFFTKLTFSKGMPDFLRQNLIWLKKWSDSCLAQLEPKHIFWAKKAPIIWLKFLKHWILYWFSHANRCCVCLSFVFGSRKLLWSDQKMENHYSVFIWATPNIKKIRLRRAFFTKLTFSKGTLDFLFFFAQKMTRFPFLFNLNQIWFKKKRYVSGPSFAVKFA